MKKTLIALAVLGAGYLGASYYTGRIVKQQLDAEMVKLKAFMPQLQIMEDIHSTGLFGSTRSTTIDLGALLSKANCVAAVDTSDAESDSPVETPAAPGLSPPPAQPMLYTVKQFIRHGPLPGFGLPAAAVVRYQFLLNGQPLTEAANVKTEGEMPVFVARYGFTGNARYTLDGHAGKLVWAQKEGKGGLSIAWRSLRLRGSTQSDWRAADLAAELPELLLSFEGKEAEMTVQLKGLKLRTQRTYPIPGQFFVYSGSDLLTMDSVTAAQGGKPLFEAQKLDLKGLSTIADGLIESNAKMTLATVLTGGETVGPVGYDFTLAKVDAAAYAELLDALFKNKLGSCPSAAQTAELTAQFKGQLPSLFRAGPELRIERISIGYGGQEALISGKLSLPAATAAQIENPMALLAMMSATLNVSLPDPLIQNLAVKSMSRRVAGQMALSEGSETSAPPTAEQIAQAGKMAQAAVAMQIEQALAKNWIVRGKDGISSSFDYRNGVMQLNGKPLDLGAALRGGTEQKDGSTEVPSLPHEPAPQPSH